MQRRDKSRQEGERKGTKGHRAAWSRRAQVFLRFALVCGSMRILERRSACGGPRNPPYHHPSPPPIAAASLLPPVCCRQCQLSSQGCITRAVCA